jgi:hypothetical protein
MPSDEPPGRPAARHGRRLNQYGRRLNQFCRPACGARGPGQVAGRQLAANACAASYHQPRGAGRPPRRRAAAAAAEGVPGRSALPRARSRSEQSAVRPGRLRPGRYPCRGNRPRAPGGCCPARYPCRGESAVRAWWRWPRAERQVAAHGIAGIVGRLIMDRPAALDPAGDGPVTAPGGQHLPGRTAVTRLPGDNYPARSPRVAGLASGRVSPPARQPRFVHS